MDGPFCRSTTAPEADEGNDNDVGNLRSGEQGKGHVESAPGRMMESLRATATSTIALSLLLLAALLQAQGAPPAAAPAIPLQLISRDARRPVPTTIVGGQELVALDDVVTLLGVSLREDTAAGGITVTYRTRSIALTADQAMASVGGRVVALPSPVRRNGRRWLVPLEFLTRALAPIYDQKIDLRRASRLLIVGDLRVPRVVGRIDATGPPTRATIEITPPAGVTSSVEAGRILLRLDVEALDMALQLGSAGLIDQIRAGDQPNTLAIFLNSRSGTPRVVTSSTADLTRVVIDVPAPNAPLDAPAPSTSVAPPAAAAPTSAAAAARPVLAPPRTGLQTIVIDPGHGGTDVGAKGPAGTEEKAITLEVARRLRTLIESRLGIRVILTRDDDRAVTPDERAALANNRKADLFLSLHANAASSPTVAGAEVFHLLLDREGEDARRRAEADAVSLPVVGGSTRTIEAIRWDLAQASHVEVSAMLAGLLVDELGGHVPMGPRPRQQAPLRVLVGANMPAALIEMAYLTNPEQEKALQSDEFQALLAQSIFDAITRYRVTLEGSLQ